ncbi:MAG TPA: MBL fold metallo-hydrolase [Bacillota bacterium]|nr:MBL fold metallo-hydrolase [Bacillota bacterium]
MNIKTMSLGPLGTNCYIIYDDHNALIVDPGGDADQVKAFIEQNKLIPQAILLTHAHFDHIGAVDELRSHFNIHVYLHEQEKSWLSNPELNRSVFFTGNEISTNEPDCLWEQGEMTIASFTFDVIHTPGHSPGSVSLIFHDDQFVISGDALFNRGIGRTDLPGGSFAQLEKSLKEGLYELPDEFTVFPGHGPKTTIGDEKMLNPFVSAR